MPAAVGVPEMVMTPLLHAGVTPAGKFKGAPIPVAPVVECVMVGITSPRQIEGLVLAAETVLIGVTSITTSSVTGAVQGLAPVTATLTNV